VTVAVIPHTYAATNLKSLKLGDPLNIEVDVLAKYAEKQRQTTSLTIDALIAQGF
jgi:riboflavin synthase